MTINEKISYIKGMFDGMGLDTEKSKEAKIIGSILEVLGEIGVTLEDIDSSFDAVDEEINAMADSLSELEEAVFDDEDNDSGCRCDLDEDDFFEVDCPGCGEPLCIDSDVLEEENIQCPSCNQKFVLDVSHDCSCEGHEEDQCGCCCDEHKD